MTAIDRVFYATAEIAQVKAVTTTVLNIKCETDLIIYTFLFSIFSNPQDSVPLFS